MGRQAPHFFAMEIICRFYAFCGMMDVMVGALRGLGYAVKLKRTYQNHEMQNGASGAPFFCQFTAHDDKAAYMTFLNACGDCLCIFHAGGLADKTFAGVVRAILCEAMLQSGKDILHLTLSSGISGTYNSACVARDILAEKYPDLFYNPFDDLLFGPDLFSRNQAAFKIHVQKRTNAEYRSDKAARFGNPAAFDIKGQVGGEEPGHPRRKISRPQNLCGRFSRCFQRIRITDGNACGLCSIASKYSSYSPIVIWDVFVSAPSDILRYNVSGGTDPPMSSRYYGTGCAARLG